MLANPPLQRAKRSHANYGSFVLVSAVILLALVAFLVCGWMMVQSVVGFYAGRIYPNVYVLGLNLGRLTPEQASTVLNDIPLDVTSHTLTLSDGSTELNTNGEGRWSVPWTEAGMHLDVTATVQAAFAVGHAQDARLRDQVRVWLRRHDVAPVFAVDPQRARAMLEQLAPSVAVSPTDATLQLEADRLVAVPGQPGRELDIEATLDQLLAVVGGQGSGTTTGSGQSNQVELIFRTIPPRVADASALQAQAEEMLERRIELAAYDVLTEETFSWTLGRADVLTWLRVESTPDGPALQVDEGAIQATLAGLAAGLGEGRGLRMDEATGQVRDAFEAGGGQEILYLTHSPRTYAVQSGDTLSGIAAASGMPVWLVLQANPAINPDRLQVGQELTIPSQDTLTPHLSVPGKRVLVSIAEQRARLYENGALIHDWPISTGIADSPTSTGVFQVLAKEENAYASLWDLWMPHFVSIYPAGPDFYNGFHGLPTLSNGRRLWEGLLGTPASYGCIILGLEEAEVFYRWAEVGVVVVVE